MLRGYLTVLVCGGLAAVLHGGLPQADSPLIASNKVKNFRGKAVTVCGKVVSHECDEKTGDTTLDLDRAYWSKPVAVLIGEDARRMFPPQLEDHYVRADICASGVVERLKGRDVVRVNGP